MIADDVGLDLGHNTRMIGKAGFLRYLEIIRRSPTGSWCRGLVEGNPALLVFDPNLPRFGARKILHLLPMVRHKVATIRDFRHLGRVCCK